MNKFTYLCQGFGTTEVFDTSTWAWAAGPPLPSDMYGLCVTELNNLGTRHLLVGGSTSPLSVASYVYDWDNQGSGWTPSGTLPVAVNFPSCARATIENGSKDVVLAVGGVVDTGVSDVVQIYQISTEVW